MIGLNHGLTGPIMGEPSKAESPVELSIINRQFLNAAGVQETDICRDCDRYCMSHSCQTCRLRCHVVLLLRKCRLVSCGLPLSRLASLMSKVTN